MIAKKIQPTSPTVAPSAAKKGDDKTTTRKTASVGAERDRKTAHGNWRCTVVSAEERPPTGIVARDGAGLVPCVSAGIWMLCRRADRRHPGSGSGLLCPAVPHPSPLRRATPKEARHALRTSIHRHHHRHRHLVHRHHDHRLRHAARPRQRGCCPIPNLAPAPWPRALEVPPGRRPRRSDDRCPGGPDRLPAARTDHPAVANVERLTQTRSGGPAPTASPFVQALPKSVRAELHERVADLLVESATDAGAEIDAFVGHHLEQAVRFRQELSLRTDTLTALARRAASTLAAAGAHARDTDDLPAATELLGRAVDLTPAGGAARRGLLWRLAQLQQDQGHVTEAEQTLEQVADLMDDAAPALERSIWTAQMLSLRSQAAEDIDPADVASAAEEAARLARQHHDLE